ncbi:hypothetical protein GCM10009799_32960 [Nocardiopsis rhodophaea]|uniref:Transposase n=1 Tax=Nocardiopsis rhodophaea TaxID=280238 RepID=A0ABP5ERI9_9ACTN
MPDRSTPSFLITARLTAEGIAVSIGPVGDAYGKALMESAVGLYKTELIKRRRPRKGPGGVKLATAEWGGLVQQLPPPQ